MTDSPSYDSEIVRFIETRQFDQAYQLASKALCDNPNHYMFFLYKGKAALELADIKKDEKVKYLDEALKCVNQSIQEKSLKNEDAYFLLAEIQAARNSIETIKQAELQQPEQLQPQESKYRQSKISLKLPPLVKQEYKSNQNTSDPMSQQQQDQQLPLFQEQKTEEIRDSSCCIIQ